MSLPKNSRIIWQRSAARLLTASAASPSAAVVMLTHHKDERVVAHFRRLKADLAGFLPAYLGLHSEEPGDWGDIRVDHASFARILPRRVVEMATRRRGINNGFCDLTLLSMANSAALEGYEQIWFVEYDVDFTGNWRAFFEAQQPRLADLLSTRIRQPHQTPHWLHWRDLRLPGDYRGADRLSAFMPVVRLSRTLMQTYLREMTREGWQGHTEALLPTVARHHGLEVAELNDVTHLSPEAQMPLDDQTYGAKPVRAERYFHEDPAAFTKLSRLYHPVKPTGLTR